MERTTSILTGGLAVLALATLLAPAARGSSWPVFHGDIRHSGVTANDAPFDSLLAWTYDAPDSIFYSSVVVADDGVLFLGTLGEDLLAISPNGRHLWSFHASGNFRHATPALGPDDTIYIGDSDSTFYAVNRDGSLRWTFTAGGDIKTAANIAPDGTIYFGADDGRLYALNLDGDLQWSYPTGDMVRSSPAIGPDGTLFFGSLDHNLYALWPDGRLRWQATTNDIIKYCSPAVSDSGKVYFGSYDGFLYAVTSDQEFLWAYPTGNVVRSSPTIGPDGRIFVGAGSNLLALEPDGSLAWEYGTGGTVVSSPVYFADDDVIGFGSDDGVFYCVHEDGSTDWTFTVGSPIRTSPAPGRWGTILIADYSGRIWCLGVIGPDAVGDSHPFFPLKALAFPNPTSGIVSFKIQSGDLWPGTVTIYDIAGRKIATLGASRTESPVWDGRNARGDRVPAGVYLFRYEQGGPTGRFLLVR